MSITGKQETTAVSQVSQDMEAIYLPTKNCTRMNKN